MNSLTPFFKPSGVVLIGASQDHGKLGYILAHNLVQSGYLGAIHFVNPKGGSLLGNPIYSKVGEVPDPVDLAVLLLPAPLVPGNLRECGERGIQAAIISSGGFRETGPEGARLEADCLEIAKQYGLRLIGPNCVGIIGTHQPLNTTFLPHTQLPPGDIAFISQSGAICDIAIDWAISQGFGLSWLVSLGNQVDVSESEVLAPVSSDPHTRVLALYLEGIRDGRQFIEEADQITRQKPIVVLKVGRSSSGQQAAVSHTGALAGQDHAYEAAFRRAGVIRAETSEQLFDWSRALAWCPPIQGASIAVLTNAGGLGVIASDAVEGCGLMLAKLSGETRSGLRLLLPPAASVINPVDMLGSATPEQYAECLKLLLADSGVSAVLIIIPPPPVKTAQEITKAIIPVMQNSQKPAVVALIGDQSIQAAIQPLQTAHIPEYRYPEKAASALAALVKYAQSRLHSSQVEKHFSDIDRSKVQVMFSGLGDTPSPAKRSNSPALNDPHHTNCYPQQQNDSDIWLPQNILEQTLAAYKIPLPPSRMARSAQEAVEIACQLGLEQSSWGVALKVISPDILHKSDLGGVLLNLKDIQAVKKGFEQIMQNALSFQPDANIQGVLVQPVIPPGQEVIIGATRDEQFGPLIMFGSGGVEVEGLKDIAFALAPLTPLDAEYLLENTWAGRKLRGYRNLPPADRSAVIEVLFRLGQLVWDFPEFAEIEINPLRVLKEGTGVFALDVRARVKLTACVPE